MSNHCFLRMKAKKQCMGLTRACQQGKAQRAPKGPGEFSGATSAKQQGVSNTETKHPELDAPGKSVKGEGETESAKLKGTVSTERPQ